MSVAVFDCETDGLLDECTKVHVLCIMDVESQEVEAYTGDHVVVGLAMLDRFDTIVCHNLIEFDLPVFKKLYGWEPRKDVIIRDTLVMSRTLWPKRPIPRGSKGVTGPHGLAAWGYRVGRGKPEVNDWKTQPIDVYVHRCVEDVKINKSTYQLLLLEMSRGQWDQAMRMEHKVTEICFNAQQRGVQLDRDAIRYHMEVLSELIQELKDKVTPSLPYTYDIQESKAQGIQRYMAKPFNKDGTLCARAQSWSDSTGFDVGGPFSRIQYRQVNIDSNSEIKVYLLREGWKPAAWNKSKKTGERTSPKLSHDDPFDGVDTESGRLVGRREQAKHRYTTLMGLLRDCNQRDIIHPRINPQGAASVRATHSVVVNIPGKAWYGNELRSVFVARKGFVLVGADSDANQLRMLAHYMKDDNFTYALCEGDKDAGTDMHSVNADILSSSRPQAKNFKYAFLFGAGDERLGQCLGGDARRGADARSKYLESYPLLDALIKRIEQEARTYKFIKGLDGRKVWCPEARKALNYLLQSGEAIYMKYVMALCAQRLSKYEMHQILWFHDEIEWEARPDIVEEVKPIVLQAFLDAGTALGITVPMPGDFKSGINWKEVH